MNTFLLFYITLKKFELMFVLATLFSSFYPFYYSIYFPSSSLKIINICIVFIYCLYFICNTERKYLFLNSIKIRRTFSGRTHNAQLISTFFFSCRFSHKMSRRRHHCSSNSEPNSTLRMSPRRSSRTLHW